MKIDITSISGDAAGSVELNDAIFCTFCIDENMSRPNCVEDRVFR